MTNLWFASASEKPAGQVRLVHIMSIPASQLVQKKTKKPKAQRVPTIERKKARRKTLVRQIKKKTENPQRREKLLRRRGIRPRKSYQL